MSSSNISDILSGLASHSPHQRLTLGAILDALGERAFALLMLLLALPNCIPMAPPIPLICGLLIAFLAVQMIAGRRTPWLPQRMLQWSVDRADAARILDRARPFIQRIERVLSPRLTHITVAPGLRFIALWLLVFALALLVAAPVIGHIPLGVAIALAGIGITERDGAVVLVGIGIGAFGVAISVGFVAAIVATMIAIF